MLKTDVTAFDPHDRPRVTGVTGVTGFLQGSMRAHAYAYIRSMCCHTVTLLLLILISIIIIIRKSCDSKCDTAVTAAHGCHSARHSAEMMEVRHG